MAQPTIDWNNRERDSLFGQIMQVLDQMPEDLREVFVLKHYGSQGPERIASSSQLDVNELDSKIMRANEVFFRSLRHKSPKP